MKRNTDMKTFLTILASVILSYLVVHIDLGKQIESVRLGATVLSTVTTDTLETFRTNVNSSLSSLSGTLAATTTSNTWAGTQTFTNNPILTTGTFGIGSTTPLGTLGIGAGTATSSISGGNFCAYFKDEAGRGMWIKLATSGSAVFATSTTMCN